MIQIVKPLKILGVRIDSVARPELEQIFAEMLAGRKFHHIATVNPEFLVEARENENFRKILNHTTLNLCDGAGISILAKFLYGRKIHRITGVEVAEILCKICAQEKKSVFFLGGFGVAKIAAEKMQKKFPDLKIAGTEDGDPTSCSEVLKNAKPDAILVAFGAPAQESWLTKFAAEIPSLRLGGGFGGTFDFWAGKVKRAPKIFQNLGIEWMWRLAQEPRKRAPRIWRAIFKFPIFVLQDRFGEKF
ncbi:WecB/TagA/CpsF family glycosyltransferase [bacterium]|jgi:N-acetylglucosaminyldiphosphoundecaprenol N-acetyl-beta-D-mannosaminyltransferase|nr:WecB/TagA/CpsF family glycosyltransferase [bacterium]MBT6831573.1 WecB/TagA/CpsF family glycosyltransferase [bacterium]MBT6995952.1 WecB/TagA/CpsF family glycosyltransferase [bacterium]MBT7772391.1 WecB/TagA/CpsF family glycosyltransferase [bacterium]